MDTPNKKRPLTSEERRECDALNAIYKAKKKSLGLTQEKIAIEGLKAKTQSAASHYLRGKNALNVEAAAVFAKYLEVQIDEFSPRLAKLIREMSIPLDEALKVTELSGFQPATEGNSNVRPTLQPRRDAKEYPVISWVAAGGWMESCDNFQPGVAAEWIASEENAGPHGYWLEVKGKSMYDPSGMAPISFPPGHRILVQPEGFDVINGKFYIARLRDPGGSWETTFKQYVRDAGAEYLQPLNPAFETLRIDENVEIIGRVIDARPPKSVF
ncbi:putative HTH-type transcriptional regulator [compost metagenome]